MATREALGPPANDPIMLERSIQLFRHLKCQNPPIISDSIGIPRWLQENAKKVSRNLIHIEEDTVLEMIVNNIMVSFRIVNVRNFNFPKTEYQTLTFLRLGLISKIIGNFIVLRALFL